MIGLLSVQNLPCCSFCILSDLMVHSLAFIYVNLSKCELYWPFGDPSLNFPPVLNVGFGLLGFPTWEQLFFWSFSVLLFSQSCSCSESIAILEDPQVELYFLHSCLGSYKIIHFLHTVPFCLLYSLSQTLLKPHFTMYYSW